MSITTIQSRPSKRILSLAAAFLGGAILLVLFFGIMQKAQAANSRPETTAQPAMPLATDLDISVRASVQEARPGKVFSYTIAYSNTTTQDISGTVLTATISSKQVWDGSYQASPPLGNFYSEGDEVNGYTLAWQIGTLTAGAQGSIIFEVRAVSTTEPSSNQSIIFLGTSAIITTTQPGISGGQADDVVIMVGPLLEIEKTASPSPVRPGHLLEYTLTINNIERQDSIPATHIVVNDALPEFSAFYRASDGGYYSPTLGTVHWELPDPLDPGASQVLTFSVLVDPDAPFNANIRNSRTEYSVTSDELLFGPLQGKRNADVRVGSLFEKSAVAAGGGTGAPKVYPDDLVTYTLTVYNPLTETLTGVVVTDTLPGVPVPFTYVRPGDNTPPDGISDDGRDITWTVDLPPWGWITRTFVVQIPRQTEINRNKTEATYRNTLDAYHLLTPFPPRDDLAPVKVQAAVIMDKITSASHVMAGDTVIYTITLTSRVAFSVTDITLTDTLEGGFRYIQMRQGPNPLPVYNSNPVVWDGLSLSPGETLELAFEARVDGDWLATYRNSLDAHSPDVFIPSRYRIAPVKVDPPLGINKGVTPQEIFIGDNVDYVITITNLSTVPFTLADEVADTLPTGFYQVGGDNPGGNPAIIDLPSPVVLQPGGLWLGQFTALASMDYGCNGLPKTIKNSAGNIIAHVTDPLNVYVTNATALAPFQLRPNILVDLETPHTKVLAGEIVTYTMHLQNISPTPANNSEIEIVLPNDLGYLQTVSGTPPTVNGQTLTWSSLTVPANAEVQVVFLVQVSPTATPGNKRPSFDAQAYGVCFGKAGSGTLNANGTVTVVEYALVLYKKAVDTEVPPLAQVEYEIWLENKLDYDYAIQSLTDTLPDGFTYFMMAAGDEPASYNSNQIVWQNVTVSANKKTKWRLILLAAPLYGTYVNEIDGYIRAGYPLHIDTDRNPRDGVSDAMVNVLPIFDLNKAVSPQYTLPNHTVIYTITMLNQSDVNYSAIRITDTLPTDFTYYRTLEGPTPTSIGDNGGVITWEELSLKGGCPPTNMGNCTSNIVFEAHISPLIAEGVYYNTIEGSSPSGSIPGPIATAPVTVTQSLGIDVYLPIVIR